MESIISFLEKNPTIIAPICTFIIGCCTVILAFWSHISNVNQRNYENTAKKEAFLASTSISISRLNDDLTRSLKIIKAISIDDIEENEYIKSIKVASRINKERNIEGDWEKLYIIGTKNIKILKSLHDEMQEIFDLFDIILESNKDMPAGVLPLFGRTNPDFDRELEHFRLEKLSTRIARAKSFIDDFSSTTTLDK